MGLTNNLGKLSNMITSTGSAVGVGTSSPGAIFDINIPNVVNTDLLRFSNSAGGSGDIAKFQYGPSGQFILNLLTNASANRNFGILNGNVGIGTSSPANYFTTTLTIDGSSSQGIMFRASGTDRGFLFQDGSFIQLGSNAGGVIFKSNDTERMRITSGGTVQVRGEGQFGLDFNATQYIQISENQIRRLGNSTLFINNSNTGDVSININGGGTFVNGTNGYGRAVTISSDERIKKNIIKIENALDKVINMNGVYYEFNTENELGINVPGGNKRIGLIAQQIESILPEAVFTSKEDNEPKSIDYSGMVGLLINAIQELNAKVSALENKS